MREFIPQQRLIQPKTRGDATNPADRHWQFKKQIGERARPPSIFGSCISFASLPIPLCSSHGFVPGFEQSSPCPLERYMQGGDGYLFCEHNMRKDNRIGGNMGYLAIKCMYIVAECRCEKPSVGSILLASQRTGQSQQLAEYPNTIVHLTQQGNKPITKAVP